MPTRHRPLLDPKHGRAACEGSQRRIASMAKGRPEDRPFPFRVQLLRELLGSAARHRPVTALERTDRALSPKALLAITWNR